MSGTRPALVLVAVLAACGRGGSAPGGAGATGNAAHATQQGSARADGGGMRQLPGSFADVHVSAQRQPDGAGMAGTGNVTPTRSFTGHAEGRGVEPPIHTYAAHVTADAWTGTGTAQIQVPNVDGEVRGTITLGGSMNFDLRGARTGSHVRAVLDPVAPERGGDVRAPDATAINETVFRGTLDADLNGDALHGTWQVSAVAGVHRRSGTVDLHAIP